MYFYVRVPRRLPERESRHLRVLAAAFCDQRSLAGGFGPAMRADQENLVRGRFAGTPVAAVRQNCGSIRCDR